MWDPKLNPGTEKGHVGQLGNLNKAYSLVHTIVNSI